MSLYAQSPYATAEQGRIQPMCECLPIFSFMYVLVHTFACFATPTFRSAEVED